MNDAPVVLVADVHQWTGLGQTLRLHVRDVLVQFDDELADVFVDPRIDLTALRHTQNSGDV